MAEHKAPPRGLIAGRQYVFDFFASGSQAVFCCLPVNACVGHRHAVLELGQVGGNFLVSAANVALDHDANNGFVAFQDLVGHVVQYQGLKLMVFVGVGVAAVDHYVRRHTGFGQFFLAHGDAYGIIVGFAVATAQNHMAVWIATGMDNGHLAFRIDAEKSVWVADRLQCINGYCEAAVSAVLEAYR